MAHVGVSGSGSIRRTQVFAAPPVAQMQQHGVSVRHLTHDPSSASVGNGADFGEDDDDDDAYLTNLTLDGVQEGPYMLCKHADDLLGHHARQVFREKAASMRGENSVYYYLKDLMRKFGSSTASHGKRASLLEPEALVLEAHGFRKLIASDPAFECAIASEQVDALFHRIEQDHQKVIRHQDFVEFCLLDHNQLRLLLFKYRRLLKKQRLTDNELADTFRRLSRSGSMVMAPELLHAAISRDLDVVLTTGEIGYLLQVMDYDRDGSVKVSDFEQFVKDDHAAYALVHPMREHAVVDLKLSVNEADQVTFKRDGYAQLFPKLQDDASLAPMHLWLKTAPREDGKAAIANIKYAASSRESELIAKGFTCLAQDVNRAGAFGKRKYIWLNYAPPSSVHTTTSEVIDLALTSGELSDKTDARLWLPPHRGFKLVPGNLNEKSARHGVFLWLRRRRLAAAHDLVDPHIDHSALDSPRAKSTLRLHIDDLEEHVRTTLRRTCPADQDGALNFARLFDEFDVKKKRGISRSAALLGIESHGIKMSKKDFALVWDRMNPFGKKHIDTEVFTHFLELNDSEVDDVVNTLQRSMTTRSGVGAAPNYRAIFQSYNALSDGKLSRADFQRMFATNQLTFTNAELSKVMQRFDVNRDGVVDYSDFLRYVTGVCDASARIASRVFDATEEIRSWAIERQNKKLAKDGNIDSTAAWKLLKTKHGLVETAALDHILRQRNVRLDADKLQLLKVLIAPATNGEINHAAFHAFVNHFPKKIKTMVYDLQKVVGPVPSDGAPDVVFDRLNVEGNGKLSLVHLARETNALALEKSVNALELKDFAYVVAWTGASCGGAGAVLIDRFVATIRETHERRNMKHEFVTHYDSPQFVEGVQLLRDEIKKCAKTLDGKLNYRVPFRVFDKDNSGEIVLSEFERTVRELGVDKYLSDQEIKSLMRRFDPNASGAIDYDEFLRFNLAESTSHAPSALTASSRKLGASPALATDVRHILDDIAVHERLSPTTVVAFCGSLKRMFAILDKDSTGCVSTDRFVQTLRDMGIAVSPNEMRVLVTAFTRSCESSDSDSDDGVHYQHFCEMLQDVCCARESESGSALTPPPSELLELLVSLHGAYSAAQKKTASAGYAPFDVFRAFGASKDDAAKTSLFLTVEELKEVLWAAGVRHPYLREELEAMLACFQMHAGAGFSVAMFAAFLERGPSALFHGSSSRSGALDVYITRLQDQLQTYLATGKDTHARLRQLFADVDADGSGAISHGEFVKLLQIAGLRHYLSPDDEALLLKFLDANGDGSIAYAEFLDFATHGDAKLNDAVASGSGQAAASPLPGKPSASPAKPASSPSGKESPSRKPTATGSPSSKPQSQQQQQQPGRLAPHDVLVYRIWKLNEKLRPAFPFAKYFRKYACAEREVKPRVFEKVVDKFLATLTQRCVTFNMHEMDVALLTTRYGVRDGAAINFDAFLQDLAGARAKVLAAGHVGVDGASSSDSDSDSELSCSSDEGDASSRRKQLALTAVLDAAVKRARTSPSDLEQLRAQLKTKTHAREHVSERKLYKLLTKLAVRLRKSEVDVLLPALARDVHGRRMYDAARFFQLLEDVVAAALGSSKPAEKATTPVPTPPPSPSKASTASSATLSPALAEKIYRCFLAAAQQNISGRKLLEKCDPRRTGAVSVLEFQTVLRLMGCALSESEVAQVKQALGNDQNAQLSYLALVEQIAQHQKREAAATAAAAHKRTPSARTAHIAAPAGGAVKAKAPLQERRPPSIQIPRTGTPVHSANSSGHSLQSSHAPPPAAALATPTVLSREETLRVDALLAPLFADLLQTRQLSRDIVTQSFAAYDSKGTGFVSADAFRSVMRKLDIWLAADVAPTVFARFASAAGDKFDYIDFCHVVCRDLSAAKPSVAATGAAAPTKLEEARAPVSSRAAQPQSQRASSSAAVELSKVPQPSISLPSLDIDSINIDLRQNAKQQTSSGATCSSRTKPTLPMPSAAGWSCPVCFHTQTRATATCEICAAQNPASVAHELLLQCAECAFRNKPTALSCELCRLPLQPHAPPPSTSSSLATPSTQPQSPKKMQQQLKLPLHIPYDDGWLT